MRQIVIEFAHSDLVQFMILFFEESQFSSQVLRAKIKAILHSLNPEYARKYVRMYMTIWQYGNMQNSRIPLFQMQNMQNNMQKEWMMRRLEVACLSTTLVEVRGIGVD